MYEVNSVERVAKGGIAATVSPAAPIGTKISTLVPQFLAYGQYDLSFAAGTIEKYRDSLNVFMRDVGDLPVEELNFGHFTLLKQKIMERGSGVSRIAGVVFAMKSMLKFATDVLEMQILDYKKIRAPKRRRRDVVYLTNAEIQQFVDSIKFEKCWTGNTRKKGISVHRLRFRTLVEVLLGTGMRISEALSLTRDVINFEKGEAKIIGKGSKERTVFFNERALYWIKFYLEQRNDDNPVIFLNRKGKPLDRGDADTLFKRYAERSGITKKLTPHILRHTMATNLLFNGCPIGHIKEILGHDRLETTCRYYLGLDKDKAKEAHGQFLNYEQ